MIRQQIPDKHRCFFYCGRIVLEIDIHAHFLVKTLPSHSTWTAITFNSLIERKFSTTLKVDGERRNIDEHFGWHTNVPIIPFIVRLRSMWKFFFPGHSAQATVHQCCITSVRNYSRTSYLAKWRVMASKWVVGRSKDENLWRQTISPVGGLSVCGANTLFIFFRGGRWGK